MVGEVDAICIDWDGLALPSESLQRFMSNCSALSVAGFALTTTFKLFGGIFLPSSFSG